MLKDLNSLKVKTSHNEIAVQMVLLSLYITPELLDSPKIMKVIIEMLNERTDLSGGIQRDLNWFVGRKIC